ncbi:hypothetical protein NIA69_19200 [Gemmiger formicilis]|nr:hypothetical protein [Gemmiger formicilis]
MTSSSDTFPFGIADVVELLGLTVRRRLPSSLYLNCPFAGISGAAQRQHRQKRLALQSLRRGGRYAGTVCPP